jgi:anti-sigma factor RsiW
MDCHDAERMIHALVDGELPSSRMEEVFLHLGTCSHCRLSYVRLQRVMRAVSDFLESEDWQRSGQASSRHARLPAGTPWMRQTFRARPASMLLAAFTAFMLGMGVMLGFASIERLHRDDAGTEWTMPERQGHGIAPRGPDLRPVSPGSMR